MTGSVVDLNPHLNYQSPETTASNVDLSIGDPRGIAWSADGTRGYVTGMGSDNLIIIDSQGNRVGQINTGQGPTGLALDNVRGQIYVWNRFDGSLSTIAISNQAVITTLPLFNPTPAVITNGRPFLYDTHLTSGLGQASCASCHVDGRTDRLAWDLGDPTSTMTVIASTNANFAAPLPASTNN
jgi:YVTN family beta-propeller protein